MIVQLALLAPLAEAAVRRQVSASHVAPSTSISAAIETGDPQMSLLGPNPLLPYDPNTISSCTFWYDNHGGIGCEEMPEFWEIEEAQWFRWNPVLGNSCDNFVEGRSYCVVADDSVEVPPTTTSAVKTTTAPTQPSTTTAPPSNGIETPSPMQPGMVANCNAFHMVAGSQSCQVISNMFGISLAKFVEWNTEVGGTACTGLWLDAYVCVGVIGYTPPATTTKPANGIETPPAIQPGMVDNCNKWHLVKTTTTCQGIVDYNKISMANLLKWNKGLGDNCENLWLNTYACVGVVGSTETTTASPTTTTPANGINTPPAIQSGMVTNCNKFHHVRPTTTCQGILDYNKISLADFFKWNPAVKSDCSGLLKDTHACVGVIGGSAPPTPTTPSNGIETPPATQSGMVTNCNKFHHVRPTTTCQGILDYNKISMADFFKWNPAVKSDCSGLLKDTHACVGVIGGSTPPTTTTPGNGISTPPPIQSGMVSNCNKFHLVRSTTTCQGILDYNKITLADFVKWNPAVKSDCSGLLKDTNACVGVIGGSSPPPTTTQPGNGIVTPQPIQTGMVKNCNKFHPVRSTTTCQGILDYQKITLADFVKWNPAVKSDCSGLQKDTNACVGVIGGSTTQPGNGIVTPQPIQPGMVKNCVKFHPVRETTTCQGILDYHKITLANFYKWNPAVEADCSKLWANTNACVGVA